MKQLKVADNMAEIIEDGKVTIRLSRGTPEAEDLLQQLIDSEQYQVTNFNETIDLASLQLEDWTQSVIN